jgi:RNA polymerase sigma-70 factor, ECF subfamily
MDGRSGRSWSEIFAGERVGQAVTPDLEDQLSRIVHRGLAAWPQIEIEPGDLVKQLARVIDSDVESGMSNLYVEDFALAVACINRAPGAVSLVEQLCGAAIATAIARVDRSTELRDEVRQVLWQRLFVGTPEQSPRILSYAGRGPLAAWMAVAAQRVALDLRREAAWDEGDPGADDVLPSGEHPEADYLRTRYKAEFEAAVRASLAGLPDRDRLLLRLITVTGLSHDQIGKIYSVNQSTVTRWIARARATVLEQTEEAVCEKLGLPRTEFRSLAGLMMSEIDLSISTVLAEDSSKNPAKG